MVKKKNKFTLFFVFLVSLFTINNVYSIDEVSLVSYWKLQNDGVDYSLNTNDLINNGVSFNGTNSIFDGSNWFDTPESLDDTYITNTKDFSINVWFNSNDFLESRYLISTYNGGNNYLRFEIGDHSTYNNKLHVLAGATGEYVIDGTTTLNPNTWYFATLTFNQSSNKMELYLNGNFEGSGVGSGNFFSAGSTLRIGKSHTFNSNEFQGGMKDITIWNKTLNSGEVLNLFNQGVEFGHSSLQIIDEYRTLGNPLNNHTFTFDVENTNLNVVTNLNGTCTYTYNNVTTPMTTSDSLTHTFNGFNMGVAQNFTKQFDLTYDCQNLNVTEFAQLNISFFQAQEPLNLDIFVPVNLQTFDFGTNLITFHIETNYQAICDYSVINLNSTPIVNESSIFENTNSSVHTTDYSALFPSVREYPLTFNCAGTILNESVNGSVLFFLDEELNLFAHQGFESTTQIAEEGISVVQHIVGLFTDLTATKIIVIFVVSSLISGVVLLILSLAPIVGRTFKSKGNK